MESNKKLFFSFGLELFALSVDREWDPNDSCRLLSLICARNKRPSKHCLKLLVHAARTSPEIRRTIFSPDFMGHVVSGIFPWYDASVNCAAESIHTEKLISPLKIFKIFAKCDASMHETCVSISGLLSSGSFDLKDATVLETFTNFVDKQSYDGCDDCLQPP